MIAKETRPQIYIARFDRWLEAKAGADVTHKEVLETLGRVERGELSMPNLSDAEVEAVRARLEGLSYTTVGDRLGMHSASAARVVKRAAMKIVIGILREGQTTSF